MARFFINNVNTYIGRALLKEFSSDKEDDNPNVIIATMDPNNPSPRPEGVKKVLNVPAK